MLAEPGKAASKTDVDILNYALVLEYLQASFYTEAERRGALSGKTGRRRYERVVGAVERAHVNAFLKLLGSDAVPSARCSTSRGHDRAAADRS